MLLRPTYLGVESHELQGEQDQLITSLESFSLRVLGIIGDRVQIDTHLSPVDTKFLFRNVSGEKKN